MPGLGSAILNWQHFNICEHVSSKKTVFSEFRTYMFAYNSSSFSIHRTHNIKSNGCATNAILKKIKPTLY
jgi:hypothetical protein